jgi:hypothetical protein
VDRADIDADSDPVIEVPVAPHPATIAIASSSPNVGDGGLDGDQVLDGRTAAFLWCRDTDASLPSRSSMQRGVT